jgi:putative sigma-54 modulation protein
MSANNLDLNISVTFRHTEPTEALKTYAIEKIRNTLPKYLMHFTAVDIVLTVQKLDHQAEVKIISKGRDVSAKAVTKDLYSAIDKVVDNLSTQLRKQKEKEIDNKRPAQQPF